MNKQAAKNQSLPIGVFDSGMGGLTVLNELKLALPNESFIYLGDTARLPYGTKSPETVIRYATQIANILVKQQIKLLVVACNTATTAALPHLEQLFPDIPVIGVVQPGAAAAVAATKNNNVAILATETTIASGIYQQTLRDLNAHINVITQDCGLFVALAEEGCIDDDVAIAATKKYLQPIIDHEIDCDCVVLACTHFPVFSKAINQVLGDQVTIVNSAKATAESVQRLLNSSQMINGHHPVSTQFLVTDLPQRFIRIGELFLESKIEPQSVQLVDIHHP